MRKIILSALFSALTLALAGCNADKGADYVPDLPDKSDIDDAKARIGFSSDALGNAHLLLDWLGIIPKYTCGEPRANFASKLPAALTSSFAGANIKLDATDPTVDKISLAFPSAGSTVQGHTVTGDMLITTFGGTDRFSLTMDARSVMVDGHPVQTQGGYATCGDSSNYFADSEGPLSGTVDYELSTNVGKKAGLPIIGSTTFLIDANGSVTRDGKTDQVTLTAVNYESGKVLPRSGTLLIVTSSGRRISATFSKDTPVVGQVKVRIDSKNAVLIPLPGF